MKKKKMNLDSLKVTSFVTNMEESTEETVKGGRPIQITTPIKLTLAEPGCPWYSELYTACTCPPSALPGCVPIEEV